MQWEGLGASTEKPGLYERVQQNLQALRKLSLKIMVKDLKVALEYKPYTNMACVLYTSGGGGGGACMAHPWQMVCITFVNNMGADTMGKSN